MKRTLCSLPADSAGVQGFKCRNDLSVGCCAAVRVAHVDRRTGTRLRTHQLGIPAAVPFNVAQWRVLPTGSDKLCMRNVSAVHWLQVARVDPRQAEARGSPSANRRLRATPSGCRCPAKTSGTAGLSQRYRVPATSLGRSDATRAPDPPPSLVRPAGRRRSVPRLRSRAGAELVSISQDESPSRATDRTQRLPGSDASTSQSRSARANRSPCRLRNGEGLPVAWMGALMSAKRPTSVVYPVHGIAEIVGKETRTIGGQPTTYVVLFIAGEHRVDDLRILVQEDRLEELGVRSAMSKETADDVLDVLAVANPRQSKTWSRRYKNHQAKLRSGDVIDLAEVVRNLAFRQRTKTLGAAEKALYRQARTALVSELAVTWETSQETAANRVDHALDR